MKYPPSLYLTLHRTFLSTGTTYNYVVKATTSAGTEGAASISVSGSTTGPTTIVPLPTNVRVGTVTDKSVTLLWTAASGVAGYDAYRSNISSGPYTKVNTTLVINHCSAI
jgi:hypothetical protein